MSGYGVKDSTGKSLFTLALITVASFGFLFYWNVFSLLEVASASFQSSFLPNMCIILWRMFCFFIGVSTIVYMFRMNTGTMVVLDHELRSEKTLHPLGIKKFVTFSSWTLLCNVIYFFLATFSSLSQSLSFPFPSWLNIIQILFFSTALGSAFLTSTIIRYIILPREVKQQREHQHQFYFHNQIMHNFGTIFLGVEIILVQPDLQPHFAIFGLFFGALYALFAYLFAYYGGGYYVYSFIDPRLKLAPIFVCGLATAISIFYLGIWLLTVLISFNAYLGSIGILVWITLIVQFRQKDFEQIEQ